MLNNATSFGSIDIPIVSTGGGGKSAIAAVILCISEGDVVFQKL
jgi:hypothetical protein